MADVGTTAHRLQTGPTIPNYTWPNPETTHQLFSTLTKHHVSQKPQLYISTMFDKNKLHDATSKYLTVNTLVTALVED